MTDHIDPASRPDHLRTTQFDDRAATGDDSPRVAAAVPITVWRLDDRDQDQPATEPAMGFGARLARRLVLTYTGHGDTVVDFDDDVHLHHAATATGRTYRAVTPPGRLAELDHIRQTVSLIILRWPRSPQSHYLGDLFTACRLMATGDACVIAALRAGDPATSEGTFADHEQTLSAAAGRAGFTHVLQIVAISAPGERDRYLYYATAAEATLAAAATPGDEVLFIHLLVFTTRESRHG